MVSDAVVAYVSNKQTVEVEAAIYDFSDGMQGFVMEAASQAKFGDMGAIGSLQVYEGPIYLDNLVLIAESYVD